MRGSRIDDGGQYCYCYCSGRRHGHIIGGAAVSGSVSRHCRPNATKSIGVIVKNKTQDAFSTKRNGTPIEFERQNPLCCCRVYYGMGIKDIVGCASQIRKIDLDITSLFAKVARTWYMPKSTFSNLTKEAPVGP